MSWVFLFRRVCRAKLTFLPKLGDVNDRSPTLRFIKPSFTFHIRATASYRSFVFPNQRCLLTIGRYSRSADSLGVHSMVRRSRRLGSQRGEWLGRRFWSVPQQRHHARNRSQVRIATSKQRPSERVRRANETVRRICVGIGSRTQGTDNSKPVQAITEHTMSATSRSTGRNVN